MARTCPPEITDPALTLERVFERMQQSEALVAEYEARGLTYCAKLERRRLAGLKATQTRIIRYYL